MSIFARFKTIQIARRGLELDILCLGPLFYYEPKHSATGGYFLPLQVFENCLARLMTIDIIIPYLIEREYI